MSSNFFDLYEIPVAFHPDQAVIRKSYLQLSREYHPDMTSPDSQADALKLTAENNAAYKTLKDDFLRIRYVLELMGEGITKEDKLPTDFLMDMMDWNETISELSDKKPEEAEEILANFKELEEGLTLNLTRMTKAYDEEVDAAALSFIKEICLKQKYLLRLKDSIDTFATGKKDG